MANSVYSNPNGTCWPLGNILVGTPGTPVGIMNLVDPNGNFNPTTGTGPTASAGREWIARCQQIIFTGAKSGGATRLVNNAGPVYIVLKAAAGGGGVADSGQVFKMLQPGETFILSAAAMNVDVLNPFDFFIDGDNGTDGCQVSLIVQ